MRITALYAALLTPLFVLLSARVIQGRRSNKAAMGDAGDKALRRRIRVHANFTEYVPFALVLIGCAESLQTPSLLVHTLGLALLTSRVLHSYGMSQERENFNFRVAGMAMTFATLSTAALTCFVGALL
ncbi:membrane-associated protein in eicosanoid and glutathione metabolism [Acaromyces ingoldii]|uniref:Membrane-associated protein in eicosanoid and glutathione metabolism n=1 Tax=Acaromyces ingoldii TaxID=215250 RepID=A0A316YFD7_9BASI|nr:membrane-associated protein in eicosanoid and glutathione metabolism [Acaromyces ingoldii]PWN86793.1 membrane-associated protein in eicosanoid and glutathione metabolism [Acaromyces ingoldii]